MEYREIYKLFCEHERNKPEQHLTAYITFAPESFAPDANYTKVQRTYIVSSDNKAFQPKMSGRSIFGSCLDQSDPCVRLDQYMAVEHGGKNGWIIEDCCLVGWFLLCSNERDLFQPKVFYAQKQAEETMLREICEVRKHDSYEDVKELFDRCEGEIEEDGWGTTGSSAWVNDSRSGNWDWSIRTAHIYSPLNIVMDSICEPEYERRESFAVL